MITTVGNLFSISSISTVLFLCTKEQILALCWATGFIFYMLVHYGLKNPQSAYEYCVERYTQTSCRYFYDKGSEFTTDELRKVIASDPDVSSFKKMTEIFGRSINDQYILDSYSLAQCENFTDKESCQEVIRDFHNEIKGMSTNKN